MLKRRQILNTIVGWRKTVMISRKNTIENDEEEMLIPEEFLGS